MPQAGGSFLPGDPITVTGGFTSTGTTTLSGATTISGATSITGTTSFTGTPTNSANAGTASTSVTAVETGVGPFHQTVLTITALAIAVSDANVGGGSKLYTFPEGNITILGATCTVAETTTSTIASTLNSGVTLSAGIGSVQTTTQASGTLATTQQDIVNAFSPVSSTVINVAAAASSGKQLGTTTIRLDGTTTPQPIWLNCGVPLNTDIDADATTTWTGTATITWVWNGDY